MAKNEKIILSISLAVAFIVTTVYLINPSGGATWDPRGRLIGYIPYKIPNISMSPTLVTGDFIITKTLSATDSEPKRNDIIVFQFPKDPSISYVKRLIGREGDRIKIINGQVFVNNEPVAQPYLLDDHNSKTYSQNFDEILVPEGKLFVLGDNRDNSNDSRFWGFVPQENLIARATYIWSAEDSDRIGAIN